MNEDRRLVIEVIKRDPLSVPSLTDRSWPTFADLPGRRLARARAHRPRNSAGSNENIKRYIEYSRKQLGA